MTLSTKYQTLYFTWSIESHMQTIPFRQVVYNQLPILLRQFTEDQQNHPLNFNVTLASLELTS